MSKANQIQNTHNIQQQRDIKAEVIVEQQALGKKLNALDKFIKFSSEYNYLPPAQQQQLITQAKIMQMYSKILLDRIALMSELQQINRDETKTKAEVARAKQAEYAKLH